MARREIQLRIQATAERVLAKSAPDPTRHKCFVSYHANDGIEVEAFIENFGHVFIPRVVGISEEDDFIDSDDTGYIMDRIRQKYLTDSTVTIVLVGKCTWARKFVDWEVYSSLRNDFVNKRNGLLAITLPSAANYSDKRLPDRVSDNVDDEDGYARWWKYPTTAEQVRSRIEIAFSARTVKANLVNNSRQRKTYNSTCP